jgi:hypothetical protein
MSGERKTLKDTQYHDSVLRAKNSMFEDIGKSLRLENEKLSNNENPVGAPNFLLALGLCCYTEYWGKLELGIGQEDDLGKSRYSFETFLKRMDCEYYTDLLDKKPIYKDIRCGLAHMYLIEHENARIDTGDAGSHGIEFHPSQDNTSQGKYIFWVRKYFAEFQTAVNTYISSLEMGKEELVRKLVQSLKDRPILI